MQQSHRQIKALRRALRRGDAGAARLLLAHSTAVGHARLAIRRYFAARFLGAKNLDPYKSYCRDVASQMPAPALLRMARDAASGCEPAEDIHLVASELLPSGQPLVLAYKGVLPRLATGPALCAHDASLLGRIVMGANSWLGFNAVIRADGHFVEIGDDFHLGGMSTVHIAHDVLPTIVGHRVTVGRSAVVHACTVGNDCVIEDGVVILDGTTVEDGVLVEAGSTVFPRSTLSAGWAYSGSPAKPVRELERGEIEVRARIIQEAIAASFFEEIATPDIETPSGEDVFVATTANLSGRIEADASSGIFFGCKLDAGHNAITIGRNTNIQDNTTIDASQSAVAIGENTTIGHNVNLKSSSIGARALIGIGADLSVGTVVDDDVLLAAGATTTPGQHLERGWLWGGRPARPISRLDGAKRAMMSAIIEQYRAYGAEYARAQAQASAKKGGTNGTSIIKDSHPHR